MSSSFVYFILAVLLIDVRFTMAFHSNIHEKMTRSERLAVFGSEDSVPKYKVFGVSLPGARRRRETNDALKLKFVIDGKEINAILTPTAGHLVTKYTPVWLARSNIHAYQNISYDPLPTAMSSIGEFKMYHDVENKAALTIYTDPTEGIIIDGIVIPSYAIRSLPKRLIDETLSEGKEIIWHSLSNKRSTTSNDEEDRVHVVVLEVQAAPHHIKRSAFVVPDNRRREKRARDTDEQRNVPKTVYPEILVVLDHNAIRNQTIPQALRYVLAFWNAVDLIYREFDRPEVRLNIAGIIIAADEWATPYIVSNASANLYFYEFNRLSTMGKYFYEENVRFPMNGYDMIIAMTTLLMCYDPELGNCEPTFDAYHSTACSPTSEISRLKIIRCNGIISYSLIFEGLFRAAQAAANIFGAESDSENNCAVGGGHVMEEWVQYPERNIKWSNCSRSFFSQYFSSTKSKCLDNKPRWTETVGEVLPGRWMSMDGQCRNEGFARACEVKGESICAAKGCRAKGSVECIRTRRVPLPGTKCASNKHCDTKKECVSD